MANTFTHPALAVRADKPLMIPQSVPKHLADGDLRLWTHTAVNWAVLDTAQLTAVSGAAFVDEADPYGPAGNPFTVVIGDALQGDLPAEQTQVICGRLGTPEIVFIRSCTRTSEARYDLRLTVLTPTGKELGACAHGFIGAIKALLSMERIAQDAEARITTALGTTAKVFIASGVISLEFMTQPARQLQVAAKTVETIFATPILATDTTLPVLSVGSPKLIVELSDDTFSAAQRVLGSLDYDALLALEDKEQINGIHLFARDAATGLPAKAIQVNAYLGRDNVIDPATGVSAAAQISADEHVTPGTTVTLTQYTARGPSAMLKVTKVSSELVRVGGAAVLFHYALHRPMVED